MKVNLEIEASKLKTLREALCRFATMRSLFIYDVSKIVSDTEYVNKLINEIDRHRPLGPDGKHNNLHTSTCGCEDK